ncbi:MAG: RagB/SusD family nutrient uptake outer membrane protein [Bacteroidota bacterium]
MKSLYKILCLLLLTITLFSCEETLEVVPPGEFSPSTVLSNEEGITALLYAAYVQFQYELGYKNVINMMEVSTDMAFNTGGGENRTLSLFIAWTWDESVGWIANDLWARPYRAIRNANTLLDNLDEAGDVPEATKNQLAAEARFIRAKSYADLYNWMGPVPLRTSTEQEDALPRASDEEMLAFIESELTASVSDLPNPGEESQYGRATKGSALGILTKFYLNTRQWDKVVQSANQIEALGYYELMPDFESVFAIGNEANRELLLVFPKLAEAGYGNNFSNGSFPPNFLRSVTLPQYEWTTSMANWATQYRLQDDFVNTYDKENDERFKLIIDTYINRNGDTVQLSTSPNNTRCLKYFDQNAIGNHHGNDFPVIRYSDILLSWAEALNELNGPTAEALELVNRVRRRAGLADLTNAEASSTDAFRDLILQERGWEFVAEGKRREDLVRQGKFVSLAQERNIANADAFRELFPIPETELNANPMATQNPGY